MERPQWRRPPWRRPPWRRPPLSPGTPPLLSTPRTLVGKTREHLTVGGRAVMRASYAAATTRAHAGAHHQYRWYRARVEWARLVRGRYRRASHRLGWIGSKASGSYSLERPQRERGRYESWVPSQTIDNRDNHSCRTTGSSIYLPCTSLPRAPHLAIDLATPHYHPARRCSCCASHFVL